MNSSATIKTDEIIVIGNGLAGLAAAIAAAEAGTTVHLVSELQPDRSQSVLAAGGINGALNTKGEDDSPEQHYQDTMQAGCWLANPEAVRRLTTNAPDLIHWLDSIGTVFSRDADGNIDLRNFGGQKKKRTAFAQAGIGRQLISSLAQEARRYEAAGKIILHEYCRFIEPLIAGNTLYGCVLQDEKSGTLQILYGKAVLAASGGPGELFGRTTGSVASDGSVTAALLAGGAALANCEMIQYHPTTVATRSKRMLISEAARGEGGRLLVYKDGQPWYFMEEWYPQGGNLMPRDVVSRGIYKVCHELGLGIDGQEQVFLDLTFLPPAKLQGALREVTEVCTTYLGLDPQQQLIPVYPGIHYFMGGLFTAVDHQCSLQRLYAAGECSAAYHGANRLGGNSTLGAVWGGKTAGINAGCEPEISITPALQEQAEQVLRQCRQQPVRCEAEVLQQIQAIMNHSLGIIRSGAELQQGLEQLTAIMEAAPSVMADNCNKTREMLLLAQAFIMSAQFRQESRGAQCRTDYPETNELYQKNTLARLQENKVVLTLEEI